MTRPGRLGIQAENERDHVEQALFGLCSTVDLIEETRLRIRQAIDRSSIVEPVLEPGLDRLEIAIDAIDKARLALSDYWDERQIESWDDQSAND